MTTNNVLKAELQRKQSVKLLKQLKDTLKKGIPYDVYDTYIKYRENKITIKQFNTFLLYRDMESPTTTTYKMSSVSHLIQITEDYNLYRLLP